eukprot:s267_g8.t2
MCSARNGSDPEPSFRHIALPSLQDMLRDSQACILVAVDCQPNRESTVVEEKDLQPLGPGICNQRGASTGEAQRTGRPYATKTILKLPKALAYLLSACLPGLPCARTPEVVEVVYYLIAFLTFCQVAATIAFLAFGYKHEVSGKEWRKFALAWLLSAAKLQGAGEEDVEVKAKLSHQKQLYEAVRTDRNLYSKKLVESQDEIAEMKRKFKIMSHQIEQLKEEIKEKEERLKRGHHAHNRMQKECEFFKDQMERAKRKEQTLKSHKETQQAEIKKLESRILEEEDRRKQQKKKYEETISERDVLGTQLIHRNDELALQYEKIKIQQRTLQNGDLAFKQRQEDARTLNVKEAQLKRELHIGKQQVLNIDDLKRQVFQLQRELLQERTKVKALSEELENPMNVHRWRKLEGVV